METKKLLLNIVFVIAFVIKVTAQTPLTVDAGIDTTYCLNVTNESTPILLGGKPTANGGVAPYTYNWIMYSKITKDTSNLLIDSGFNHNANISVHCSDYPFTNNIYVFKVTVTDANGIKESDSTIIGISMFWFGASAFQINIPGNDSIQLNVVTDGGTKPFTYEWKPATGLSNTTIQNPKVIPSVATQYTVELIDLVGCKTSNSLVVTNILNGDLTTGFVSYKNPVSNSGTMHFTPELMGSTLQIVSVSGIVQYQTKVEEESIPLGSLIPTSGIYYYTLTTTLGKVVSGSFVRE